jgi:hypothetical protein
VRPDLPRPVVAAVDRALAVDPARRPTAKALSRALRGVRREPAKAPLRPMRLRLDRRVAERIGASAGVAVAAAWVNATLPFFPARWPILLAVLAAALTAFKPRLGLAFALAVPVFPLGNVALGLAVLYAAAAAAWLVLAWPRPRSGLLFAVGAVLAPVGALGLLPLLLFRVRGWFRRFVYGAAGVLLTAFAGVGQLQPVATEESPARVADWLWGSTAANSDLALLGLVVGGGAAMLPGCARRGELAIGAGAAGLLAGALVAAPSAPTVPFVLTAWLTAAALVFRWRRSGGDAADIHGLDTLLRTTHAFFLSRVKPAGGPRWPRALSPQRLGHAARR